VLDATWAEYWRTPGDRALLRVYADALDEAGDPRGKFIQLSLVENRTPAQQLALDRLAKKSKGDLIGPAKAFLRETVFGPDGLVMKARAEAEQVIAGIAEISALNPRLILTITSVKSEKLAKELGKISLGKIYFVDFGCITGRHGNGCRISDKQLAALAPALADVEHLQLSLAGSAAGRAEDSPTPAGFRVLGTHLERLRFLACDYYVGSPMPPAEDYADAIRETPGFSTLEAIEFPSMQQRDLPGVKVNQLVANQQSTAILRSDTAAKVESLFRS
jgi:uncharacterized protein (TIGR02996 family)